MPEQALSDVKVLDFTHYIAGPYCTKLLADYGADVVKVERSHGGDGARRLGPFPQDLPHSEKSGLFLHLNTNKRSVTLNLKTEAARKIARELAADVDVVVESFRPGDMAGFGLGYDSLKALNPRLVMTSISNFGQTGPYRDYRASDIILYGMGGEMYSTGLEEREPLKMGGHMTLYQAGSVAAVATMAALLLAQETGTGQHVDISIMETQAGSIDRRMAHILAYQYCGEISGRVPFWRAGYPMGVYPCQDGYVEIMGGLGYWPRVVEMLGNPDFLNDPKWYAEGAQQDPELREEFDAFFIPWCLERTKVQAWEDAQRAKVISGPLNTMEDLNRDSSFNERGAFVQIDHPEAGGLKYPGRPFIMKETPWAIQRPAPLLGQHNEEMMTPLGYSKEDLVRLREQDAI